MTSRWLLVTASLVLPLGAHAEPTKQIDRGVGVQFAKDLTTSEQADGTKARTPKLSGIAAPKVEPAGGRTAETPQLATTHAVAPSPQIRLGSKSEASEQTPSHFRPAAPTTEKRASSLRPQHRTKLAAFEVTKSAGQVDDLARAWKRHPSWDAITIDGYAVSPGLGQRGADQVRAALAQHGVPAELVIAVGHIDETAGAATTVEVSVTTCDGVTIQCRQHAAEK